MKIIEVDLANLRLAQDTFWSVQSLIRSNPKMRKRSSFYRYLGDTYVSHVLMGIRRQVKNDKSSISLVRLLDEIARHSGRLSRNYHRTLYRDEMIFDVADHTFDQFCDHPGEPHVSTIKVQRDIAELQRVVQVCEDYADRRVAHRDKRQPEALPRFSDIDDSIDNLDKIYVRYLLALSACSFTSLTAQSTPAAGRSTPR